MYNNSVNLSSIGFPDLEVCVLNGNQLIMWHEKALFATLKATCTSCGLEST